MPIKYSCFISYRRLCADYARDFHVSLERELRYWTSLPIYRDEERLSGGDFYNRGLASALCESACMVMIYTPNYFDKKPHTYCAREYKAMEMLETQRLRRLDHEPKPKHGLIIPVIYRGLEDFPDSIRKLRSYYEFEFSVCRKSYFNRKDYLKDIKKIAEYIYHRCNELDVIDEDPCESCDKFKIPTDSEISPWLLNMLRPQKSLPIVGR